ncbi:unnamed protein product, partial [Didymodactylos carnosus]
ACVHGQLTNDDLLKLVSPQCSTINGPTLFALKYRVVPCTTIGNANNIGGGYNDAYSFTSAGHFRNISRGRRWGGKHQQGGMFHATSAIQFLVDGYKADPETFIYDCAYDTSNKGCLISKLYVYHVPKTAERARTLLEQLTEFKLFPIAEATLQMVCHDAQRGFYTSAIQMKKPHITDLKVHYGDEFPDVHEELLKILQEKDSTGITFLHGPPGTGKTFYLRYLINEIKDKSLIYVPPDMVNDMTKPGFLPFLMQHPNSILIVEDAENIIRDRKQEKFLPNQAVANLLNLSDGLLGDAMHQQIICTFNCDVKGVDPALLRDGRLVIEHKFDKLSVENARLMCVEMGILGNGEDIYEPITLAEIYARKTTSVEASTNAR